MKIYEIEFTNEQGFVFESKYIKTDATKEQMLDVIDFIKRGAVDIEVLLKALRILGLKATEVKVEPVDSFVI